MILPDTNLLIYAVDQAAMQHDRARDWLEEILSGTETVALAWSVVLGFLRITTSPRIVEEVLSAREAADIVRGWLAQPPVTVVAPTARHIDRIEELLAGTGSGGNLVNDAQLAALAIEHGATLHSADHDFGRFPGLRWHNPLAD